MPIPYTFTASPWKYSGQSSWVFVSLPKVMAKEIRELLGWEEQGWGRLQATAKIGNTEWKSAIWWDTKHETYLLPLKAEVRRKEKIVVGSEVEVVVMI